MSLSSCAVLGKMKQNKKQKQTLRVGLSSTSMMDSVSGSVMTLSRSGASSPVWMLKDLIMRSVSLYRTPVAASRGSRISTDSQLKKSWTVAPAKALEVEEDAADCLSEG